MATRIQMRRGTTSQWNTADPVLNEGEIGYNTTLGAFKVGDGATIWSELDYYQTTGSITPQEINAIDISEKGAANGVAELDADKNVITASKVVFEGATADAYETYIQVGAEPAVADTTFTLPTTSGTIALTSDLSSYAPLSGATFTGAVTGTDLTLSGNLTVNGTTTTIDTQNLLVEDKNITIGAVTSPTDTTADGGGITLKGTSDKTFNWVDATDSWTSSEHINLSSGKSLKINGTDVLTSSQVLGKALPSGDVVGTSDSQTLTNKTLNSPTINNATFTGQASGLEIAFGQTIVFEGTTADSNELTLSAGEPTADRTISFPDVSGTVVTTGDTGTVTSTMIANGTIVNDDINASAAIDKTKISGTAITAADTGTVTSTMIADGTIVNADINASAAIAVSKLAANTISGVTLGNNLNALTIGTGLSGTSYNGSSAVTIAIDSTVTTTSGTQTLTNKTLGSSTALGADLSAATYKITNLGTPSASADAVTKQYVDDIAQGLHIHASCVTATTNNIDLSTGLEAGDVIDGVTLVAGDRVLVKNQSTTSQNGIYLAVTSGAAVRASDFDSSSEIQGGDFVFVTGGTANDNTGWVQTEKVTTVGTDPIVFTQFSGAGTYQAGTGLTLTGNTFSINTGTTVDVSTAQTLTNKTIALGSNTISGTTAQFNSALTDGDFATLAGSEALTNKTISGTSNTITNVSLTTGVTGTLPVANGGTGITAFGTGVATALGINIGSSGAFVTNGGALGTPSSGTLTNATGLPVTSGISGLGTGIATFLATPSSANLASAVTDETGSGSLVFGTSPTIATPTLTLSGTNSTTEGRIAWDQTNSQIDIGNGSAVLTFTADSVAATLTSKTLNNATLTGTLTAGGSNGTSGQVLQSTGTGVQWATASSGGASFSELMLVGC